MLFSFLILQDSHRAGFLLLFILLPSLCTVLEQKPAREFVGPSNHNDFLSAAPVFKHAFWGPRFLTRVSSAFISRWFTSGTVDAEGKRKVSLL